ncbi:N-acetyltransferase [Brevundimonas sp.]|uniref:GNAT family N-acetyltransferase n=1 Tax=Brevundimonas sp. TaxID=1871086 RepID=UPI002D2ABA49|nr:N-acetyltransferase [Brevundimonas sp.]HYD28265.1 N-acetyltransferase [Brevundimonas sp.]
MSSTPALSPVPHIDVESPADAPAVEALVLAAFGPGRYAKTAERLREQARRAVGFVVRIDGRIVGSVRLWAVSVGGAPALFLGPIAVDVEHRSAALGAELVARCLEYAASDDAKGVLLVGDLPYFGRFGFVPAPDVRMPGPADQRRVLWRGPQLPQGLVRPLR